MLKTCFLCAKEGLVKGFLHIFALTSLGRDLTGMRIHGERKEAPGACVGTRAGLRVSNTPV